MGASPPPGVLDQRADDHICAHIAGLYGIHKFTVAVVHHTDQRRLLLLDEGNQLADLLHRERGAGLIALERWIATRRVFSLIALAIFS